MIVRVGCRSEFLLSMPSSAPSPPYIVHAVRVLVEYTHYTKSVQEQVFLSGQKLGHITQLWKEKMGVAGQILRAENQGTGEGS